ncbi:MAG TPA: trans-aconitate 2-methyltransferase [Candidatus Obscuribacter sp.]|nr:trans-aconitate 2-methyltransferase [Candidatus Obscuribacter sp.]HMY03833.1 trans-aconitate 2-methyltransferase [Candidatus Obscuribacter sp.]HNG21819.1 trans-aconitate 2-methyltransferase [Candidatus Obscuribacter sp.]
MMKPEVNFGWDPGQYTKFLSERTRPAIELLSRLPAELSVKEAVDLGCGPGNSSAVVYSRFPAAKITGIDSSPAMIQEAGQKYPYLHFAVASIDQYESPEPVDLIFSNAALHWVSEHEKLLPRLMNSLRKGGALAVQMPNNHMEITHTTMREIATDFTWSKDLSAIRSTPPVLEPEQYYDMLIPLSASVDIWQTKYFHVMNDAGAIGQWLCGTGLRPFLDALPEGEAAKFLELYVKRIAQHLKPRKDGKILMPFPRLFIVAIKN